jgi:hypothetical protein
VSWAQCSTASLSILHILRVAGSSPFSWGVVILRQVKCRCSSEWRWKAVLIISQVTTLANFKVAPSSIIHTKILMQCKLPSWHSCKTLLVHLTFSINLVPSFTFSQLAFESTLPHESASDEDVESSSDSDSDEDCNEWEKEEGTSQANDLPPFDTSDLYRMTPQSDGDNVVSN